MVRDHMAGLPANSGPGIGDAGTNHSPCRCKWKHRMNASSRPMGASRPSSIMRNLEVLNNFSGIDIICEL